MSKVPIHFTLNSNEMSEFVESSADLKLDSLPLSHVSVELGHLYMEGLAAGEVSVVFEIEEAEAIVASAVPPVATRSSTRITRSPFTMASSCISISSMPYSSE